MIRELKENDINKVMELWLNENILAHNFISNEYWMENYEKVKNEYIPNADTYVYDENGEIKGFISILGNENIGALFIDSKYVRQGIGTKLVEYLKQKNDKLLLHVYVENKNAVEFYKKLGFEILEEKYQNITNQKEFYMKWEKKNNLFDEIKISEKDKIFKLKNVNKIFSSGEEQVYALNQVNLNINEGEICVILGPSGSGKSTLLNVLSGIDIPTDGKIIFDDERIDKLNDVELTEYRKENLGFIFQSYNLVSNLTIGENVELGYQLGKNPLDIDEVLETVGLLKHKYKFPYQLSGGEQQRVAIARAIVKNPKVLLCDEPTGALDENMGKQILKLIKEINLKYKTTIIMVTHNPSVAYMANTVIKMNSGKVINIIENNDIMEIDDIRWA